MENSSKRRVWPLSNRRPERPKGFVFMSVSDETDIFNVIVTKEFFE